MNDVKVLPVIMLISVPQYFFADTNDRNLFLNTLDGVRIQEIFAGIDPILADASSTDEYSDIDVVKNRYWRESATARFTKATLPRPC